MAVVVCGPFLFQADFPFPCCVMTLSVSVGWCWRDRDIRPTLGARVHPLWTVPVPSTHTELGLWSPTRAAIHVCPSLSASL